MYHHRMNNYFSLYANSNGASNIALFSGLEWKDIATKHLLVLPNLLQFSNLTTFA